MSAILISLNFNWIKEMIDSRIAEIRLLDKLQNSLNVCGTLCQREINIYLCIFVLFFFLSLQTLRLKFAGMFAFPVTYGRLTDE